jgi:pyruvate kinase
MLRQLIGAGMDVARLNFSHGHRKGHAEVFENLRAAERETGKPIAVLQDLQGPKIRVTALEGGAVELQDGDRITVRAGLEKGAEGCIGTDYPYFAEDLAPGARILLDDGLIELTAREVRPPDVLCEVVHGGVLREKKGINLPGARIRMPALTEKDRADLRFGLELGVDYVALSFVRHPDEVRELRRIIEEAGSHAGVVAKIEKPEALDHLEAIIEACDAVMIARGDLGVEMEATDVPMIQKRIIKECLLRDRPAITATQMLDSMRQNPRPTRAEVSDVANAILDGTDAVMLSGETAVGRYPIRSTATMARIAAEAERYQLEVPQSLPESAVDSLHSVSDAICHGAYQIARELPAKAIVVFTATGRTALYISKTRPSIPVVAAAFSRDVMRKTVLFRSVIPICIENREDVEDVYRTVAGEIVRMGLAESGDLVIYIGGRSLGIPGSTNMIRLDRIP